MDSRVRGLRTVSCLCVTLLLCASAARAQKAAPAHAPLPDSVKSAIQRYRAALAAGDSCRRATPLPADTAAAATDSASRALASGKACPGSAVAVRPPTAYVIDGILTCPSLHPSEWGDEAAAVRPDEVLRIEVSTDSLVLSRVRCAVPPLGVVWLTTNRPGRGSAP